MMMDLKPAKVSSWRLLLGVCTFAFVTLGVPTDAGAAIWLESNEGIGNYDYLEKDTTTHVHYGVDWSTWNRSEVWVDVGGNGSAYAGSWAHDNGSDKHLSTGNLASGNHSPTWVAGSDIDLYCKIDSNGGGAWDEESTNLNEVLMIDIDVSDVVAGDHIKGDTNLWQVMRFKLDIGNSSHGNRTLTRLWLDNKGTLAENEDIDDGASSGVYLYYEHGTGYSFDGDEASVQLDGDSGSATDERWGDDNLSITVTNNADLYCYIVVKDIMAGATIGRTADFEIIADGMSLDNFGSISKKTVKMAAQGNTTALTLTADTNPPELGAGDIWNVYWNHPDQSSGTQDTNDMIIRDKLLERIDALESGDSGILSTFSFSGSSDCCGQAGPILSAISNALDRGASMSFIADGQTPDYTTNYYAGTSLSNEASRGSNPLTLVVDDSTVGIHHNKTAIFDYGVGDRWVFASSENLTGAGSFQWNTAFETQNSGLYDIYYDEFAELLAGRFHDHATKSHATDNSTWSLTGSWDLNHVRFAPYPEQNGTNNLSGTLTNLILSAQDEIVMAVNTFTLTDLYNALRDAADANTSLKITIAISTHASLNSSSTAYDFLTNGANYSTTNRVRFVFPYEDDEGTADPGTDGDLIHTRYTLIDPLGTDPVVVHGSANYSVAGLISTNFNDENTLITRHASVACAYYQQFQGMTGEFGSESCSADPGEGLQIYVGTNLATHTQGGTNIIYQVTDADLFNAGASNVWFSFKVYDEGSGIARATNGYTTNMNITVAGLTTNNVAQYDSTRSASDTTIDSSTSVWTYTSFTSNQISSLLNTTNKVTSTVVDKAGATLTNQQFGYFAVVDDDAVCPVSTSIVIYSVSGISTASTTDLQAGADWSITGLVYDVDSGVNVEGTSVTQPTNSPYFILYDPSGAAKLTNVFNTSFNDGEATSASAVSNGTLSAVSGAVAGIWTVAVIVADNDEDSGTGDHQICTNFFSFTVIAPCTVTPVSTNAISITSTSFVARWESSLYADGYCIDVATNSTFSSAPANLVDNPGFETGDSTDWDKFESGYSVDSSDPNTGTYAAKCVATATRDLAQDISITGDGTTEYEISFWYKKTAGDSTSTRIWSSWSAGGQVSGDNLQPSTYLNASTWTKATYNVVPNSGANTLHFEVRTYNGGTVFYDDFFVGESAGGSSYVPGYEDNCVGNVTNIAVTGLTANVTYYYRVRATNSVCVSDNSTTQSVTTASGPAEIVVLGTNLQEIADGSTITTVTNGTDFGSVLLSATLDHVYTITNSGGATLSITGATLVAISGAHATNFTVTVNPATTIAASTQTTFTIHFDPSFVGAHTATVTIANDDADEDPYTFVITGTGYCVTPDSPTTTAATSVGLTGFTANWTASTIGSPTNYILDVSTDSGFASYITGYNSKDMATALTEVLASLTPGQTYYYRLRAQNDCSTGDTSTNSATISVTLACFTAPTATVATAIGSTSFDANWTSVTGADGYLLDVSSNETFGTEGAAGSLFISEVSDPGDVFQARFVEFYNATGSDIDFDTTTWYLSKQVNGGSWTDIQLSGVATAGTTFVIASTELNFTSEYGVVANQYNGGVSGNGDDGYYLYEGGNHTGGTLTDAYGVIGEDGTGNAWEYLDTHATRTSTVNSATSTWTSSEWIIPASADVADMTPGVHTVDASSVPDFVPGYSNRVVSGTTQSVTGLTSGVTYYYRVIATNEFCVTDNSNTQSVTTVAVGPDITVLGTNLAVIADGSTVTTVTNGTDYGDLTLVGATLDHVFSITNNGVSTLSLTGTPLVAISGTHATNFTVTVNPASTVTASNVTTFTIHFDPSSLGVHDATVTIESDDADENPYTFDITGAGVDSEIAVLGTNLVVITDGNTTPTATEGTDFGDVLTGGGQLAHTFTVTNSGTAALFLDGVPTISISGAHATNFVLTTDVSTTNVAAGAATTFTITFDPNFIGVHTATVSIANSDATENPYDFTIIGNGTCVTPNAPDVQAATGITATGFTANWTASTIGAPTNYIIDVSTDSGFASFITGYNAKDVGTAISEAVSSLTAGRTYYYRVRAQNDCTSGTTSTNSATITVTVDCFSVTVLPATGISSISFTANWSAVTGADGYCVDVSSNATFAGAVSDLFISEYVEGSSNNKYLELYNGTAGSVALTNYSILIFANGSATPTATIPLTGTLSASTTFVIEHTSEALGVSGNMATNLPFNGDDAIALTNTTSGGYVDIIGQIGTDPGSGWGTSPTSTVNNTLRRMGSIVVGDTDGSDAFVPTAEWDGYVQDTVSGLGSHSLTAGGGYVAGYSNNCVGAVTSLAVTGLTDGVTYYYRVRATNAYCTSVNSSTQSVVTTSTSVDNPTGANAVADGAEAADLTWTNNAAGDDVVVVRSTNATLSATPTPGVALNVGDALGGGEVVFNGVDELYKDVELDPGTLYYWHLFSVSSLTNYSTGGVNASATTETYGDIIYDPMSYTNAVTPDGKSGGIGYTSAWSDDGSTLTIGTNGSFGDVTGYPATHGHQIMLSNIGNGNIESASRNIDTIDCGSIYVSFLMSYQYSGAKKFAGLELLGNTDVPFFGELWSDSTDNKILGVDGYGSGLGVSSSFNLNPYSSDTNNVYLIIGAYDFDTREIKVNAYYAPSGSVPVSEPATWDASATVPVGNITSITGIRLKAGSTDSGATPGSVFFDEIRIGTRWDDITGINATPTITNYTAGTDKIVFDSEMVPGTFKIWAYLQSEYGIDTDGTPYAPDFDILTPDGTQVIANQDFGSFTALDATSVRAEDTSHSISYANVVLGVHTVRVSAVSSNGAELIDGSSLGSGCDADSSLTFEVFDDDLSPPGCYEISVAGELVQSSSNLNVGSLAIIGVNVDPATSPETLAERFTFVVLDAFPSGTIISFTDNGWRADTNDFLTAENHFNAWTASTDFVRGDVITLDLNNLNNGGDQVVIYQTNSVSTTFIFAVNMGWTNWQTTGIVNETSALYPSLDESSTAPAIPYLNGSYTGTLAGTHEDLLSSIADPNNWYDHGANTTMTMPTNTFTVIGSSGTITTYYGGITVSDGNLHDGGYIVTNAIQDDESGLVATGDAPYYVFWNTEGNIIVSNAFDITYSNGYKDFVILTNVAPTGVYDNITLGTGTAVMFALDYDNDRPNDDLESYCIFPIDIYDDDTNPPSAAQFGSSINNTFSGGGAGSKTMVIATNGIHVNDRSGSGSNVIYELTDGYLFDMGINGDNLQIAIGATDTNFSGIYQGNSGTTNEVISFSVGAALSGSNIIPAFDATASGTQTNPIATTTSIWTFADNTIFTASVLNDLFSAGTSTVFATIPDADRDRTNDQLIAYHQQVGHLAVIDDDFAKPQFGTALRGSRAMGFLIGGTNTYGSGTGMDGRFTLTDAELAAVSSVNPMEFVFNVYDTDSGIGRTNDVSKWTTNLNFDIGTLISDVIGTYSNSLSSADDTINTSTSVFYHPAAFSDGGISTQDVSTHYFGVPTGELNIMVQAGTGGLPVRASVFDADYDRGAADILSCINETVGWFVVEDEDTNQPIATLKFAGNDSDYTVGAENSGIITDEDILNGTVTFAYEWRDTSGLFVTNNNGAVERFSGFGNVSMNFDLQDPSTTGLGLDAVHALSDIFVVNNDGSGYTAIGSTEANGALTVLVRQTSVSIDCSNFATGTWNLTVSAQDHDLDRGTYPTIDLSSDAQNVSFDREVTTNQLLQFTLIDDDTVVPGAYKQMDALTVTPSASEVENNEGTGSNTITRINDGELRNISSTSALHFVFYVEDESDIARGTTFNGTNMYMTITDLIWSNTANYSSSDSSATALSGNNSSSIWAYTTAYTYSEVSDLFTSVSPNLGGTNEILITFNDRDFDLENAGCSGTDWLGITNVQVGLFAFNDDDAEAPSLRDISGANASSVELWTGGDTKLGFSGSNTFDTSITLPSTTLTNSVGPDGESNQHLSSITNMTDGDLAFDFCGCADSSSAS